MATIKPVKLKDRSIAYDVRVKVGKIRKSARLKTKAECREWIAATEAEKRAGTYTVRGWKITLSQVIDRYKREILSTRTNHRRG